MPSMPFIRQMHVAIQGKARGSKRRRHTKQKLPARNRPARSMARKKAHPQENHRKPLENAPLVNAIRAALNGESAFPSLDAAVTIRRSLPHGPINVTYLILYLGCSSFFFPMLG